MPPESDQNSQEKQNPLTDNVFPRLIFLAVLALTATFLISNLEFSFVVRFCLFVVITAFYVAIAARFYKMRSASSTSERAETIQETSINEPETVFSSEIEEKLLALEEANTLFGSSLKPADMFRLISTRIGELIPFSLSTLYLAGFDREKLKIAYVFGRGAVNLTKIEIEADSGIAGKTFQSGEIRIDEKLTKEKSIFPAETLGNVKSAIACPLTNENGSYGVLTLYSSENAAYDDETKRLLNAAGKRISPLFSSSIAFENNLNSALNDSLTDLPNERALFMLLENQVAESQRFREQRPLTILSIDIKDFEKINSTYGHATGDRILSFVAGNIKEQLRQMDVLSRLAGDEFLAVLPTSSDKTTEMIVERIKNTFASNAFVVTPQDKVFIELNFGQASFIKDGETAQDLIKIAAIKKREAKSSIKSSVLWFPKEYSN